MVALMAATLAVLLVNIVVEMTGGRTVVKRDMMMVVRKVELGMMKAGKTEA